MEFIKMEGLGNDYIYINDMIENRTDYVDLAIELSDRHFGIGADGIITICKSDKADCFMQIYNADGSLGEMCGNGIRCVAKYLYDNYIAHKKELTVDTLAGLKYLKLEVDEDDKVTNVEVNMGIPTAHNKEKLDINKVSHDLKVDDITLKVMDISMGNPHTVIFVDNLSADFVNKYGPLIESHPYYPNKTNVEFVKVVDDFTLNVLVWERGSGRTLACGTGACASSVAHKLKNNIKGKVTINLEGGSLSIDTTNDEILMTGPAKEVYKGTINTNKKQLAKTKKIHFF